MSDYRYGYRSDDNQINKIIENYLKEHIDELRHDILNLDDYVCRDEFENFKSKLEEEKQNLSNENSRLTGEVNDLNIKLTETKAELSANEEIVRKAEESQYYMDTYKTLEDGFKCYKKLSVSLQNSLAGVIGYPKNGFEFICSISQSSNLETLWDFAAYELNNQRVDDDESINLENFFRFAFSAVNQGSNKKFVLIESSIGDPYNSNVMRKTSKSKQLGTVCKVLLPGIKNRHTGKIIRPVLVEIV